MPDAIYVLKFRHKWSHANQEWYFSVLGENRPSKEALDEMVGELRDEYDWSEYYRGVDYELLEWSSLTPTDRNAIRRKYRAAGKNLRKQVEHNKRLLRAFGNMERESKPKPKPKPKFVAEVFKNQKGEVKCRKL